MYEHRADPLLPRAAFVRRIARHGVAGFALVACADALGTVGYHYVAGFAWVDALLNASMILAGMGPVGPLSTTPAKLFASAYALFSGLLFVAVMAVVLAPWLHRLIHRVHLDGR